MNPDGVVVVGAGAAGLGAARALVSAHRVLVLDKARGVGGRMATRRIGAATFDHGAQFLTAHHDDLAVQLAAWTAQGVTRPWFRGRVGPTGVEATDRHVRHRGAVSMNAVAKHLADGLDVRRAARVVALAPHDGGWRIELEEGPPLGAGAVVLTAPVPQALELLAQGGVELHPDDATALRRIEYDPCLAAMVPLDGPSGLPEPGAVAPDAGPIDWIADNVAKGISEAHGVTIHAGAAASAAWWDRADADVVEALVDAAHLASAPLPAAAQVQRWRYARPTVLHPAPCLLLRGPSPLVLAGDAFGEARVEGALRSGAAAAAALGAHLDR